MDKDIEKLIEVLTLIGGKRWSSYGKDRVYFDASKIVLIYQSLQPEEYKLSEFQRSRLRNELSKSNPFLNVETGQVEFTKELPAPYENQFQEVLDNLETLAKDADGIISHIKPPQPQKLNIAGFDKILDNS